METLKEQLREELEELRPDFGDEEVDNTLETLEKQNDDLSSMGKWDVIILTRLLNDNDLIKKVEDAYPSNHFDDLTEDIFD